MQNDLRLLKRFILPDSAILFPGRNFLRKPERAPNDLSVRTPTTMPFIILEKNWKKLSAYENGIRQIHYGSVTFKRYSITWGNVCVTINRKSSYKTYSIQIMRHTNSPTKKAWKDCTSES